MQEDANGRYYESSTFMALSFVLKRGIARDITYPLSGHFPSVGYYVENDDRAFERDAEIYRPFNIPNNISSGEIRLILERHGPLI
ncbi:unnamed protein product [Trifolium pratense]|uniref:Uncharacterized protein n=1 Tax=Trifolium pratense TaxID=57577 RepID=A0ACB0IS20_TRIPR|nr:unnamed protein product [Trifolium pratense]